MDQQQFANPPVEYRPVPFWSWNDLLEAPRLAAQMKEFCRAGNGGVFMHARPGMWTPFLSAEWFAAVETTIKCAKDAGMHAWIYDESSFPSGFAGGLVMQRRPDLAQHMLACKVLSASAQDAVEGPPQNELGRFQLTSTGYRRLQPGELVAEATVLSCTVEKARPSNWLNGYPYADLLNPESAATFIEVGYEPYKARFSAEFGRTIPGVFTDEPNIQPGYVPGAGTLPWTAALPQAYYARFGENLIDRLPELFADVGDYGVVRTRYWQLVTDLFISTWVRPMYEWCDRNGLQFTGHFWEHEFTPMFQGSLMAPLEYMHVPGIDLLGRDILPYRLPQDNTVPPQVGNVHIVKVMTSVAHQLGRNRTLSETYGGSGWDLSFESQKRYGDWEYVLGINFLNQHLSHYSLRGYRKHDFPIAFQSYQPWWPDYHLLTTYFSRLSYALSQGNYQAELLVLHPMASLWVESHPSVPNLPPDHDQGGRERIHTMYVQLDHLLKSLAAASWAYDLGDDTIMSRHADVQVTNGKPAFCVGKMQYQAVVIPPATNLCASTLRLLQAFANAGGTVYALAPVPQKVDGAETDLSQFLNGCQVLHSEKELLARLAAMEGAKAVNRQVRLSTSTVDAPIYHLVRSTDDGDIIFLANVGPGHHYNEKVWVRGATGAIECWNLVTGQVESLPAQVVEDGLEVTLDFPESASHLLFHRKSATTAPVRRTITMGQNTRRLEGTWRFHRLDPNVLVLDRGWLCTDGANWQGPLYTSQMGQILREAHGSPAGQYRDKQPWAKHPSGAAPVMGGEVAIRYEVSAQLDASCQPELVVEDAGAFAITVNGQPVTAPTGDSWWLDPAFLRIPINTAWRQGKNIIELRFRFQEDLAIEPAFILGNFALTSATGREYTIVAESDYVRGGSWVDQGYPFYAGRGVYEQDVTVPESAVQGRAWLCFDSLPNVTRVFCNGVDAGVVAWQPYRVELTGLLHPGANHIELRVANSLHNLLGPQHKQQLNVIVAPNDFSYSKAWTPDYRLVPDGIASQVRLVWG